MALENLASKDGETKLGKSDQANLSLTTTLNHRLGFLDVKEEAHGLQRSKNPLEKYDLAELTAQSHEPALIPLAIFRADHGAVRDQRVQHNLGKDNKPQLPAILANNTGPSDPEAAAWKPFGGMAGKSVPPIDKTPEKSSNGATAPLPLSISDTFHSSIKSPAILCTIFAPKQILSGPGQLFWRIPPK